MKSSTPFLKNFGPLLFGRRPLPKVVGGSDMGEFYNIFKDLIPASFFEPSEEGVNSRRRLLPAEATFWAFLSQALSPGSPCREIVRRLEAWWHWSGLNRPNRPGQPLRVSESAYCQARKRLPKTVLHHIFKHTALVLEQNVLEDESLIAKRSVKIVDGTMLSMPDTLDNQQRWPQSSQQQPGLGFPLLKMVALFSLESGAMTDYATGSLRHHESQLFRSLFDRLETGDILLGDRAFCSYASLCALVALGCDGVFRLHQARKIDFREGRRLGPDDRLLTWLRPTQRPPGISPEEYAELPASLAVRMIRLQVAVPGFRTQSVTFVTSLTDPVLYPVEKLRELYGRRWQVELYFAQIKTTLGLDILRCKTPAMIEKEVLIHLIAYNLVRGIMQKSAHHHHRDLGRISFKGSLDTIRHFARPIHLARNRPGKARQLVAGMLELIACDAVPERPGRSEPRAKKRRAKNYHLLTKPRKKMQLTSHRNRAKSKKP